LILRRLLVSTNLVAESLVGYRPEKPLLSVDQKSLTRGAFPTPVHAGPVVFRGRRISLNTVSRGSEEVLKKNLPLIVSEPALAREFLAVATAVEDIHDRPTLSLSFGETLENELWEMTLRVLELCDTESLSARLGFHRVCAAAYTSAVDAIQSDFKKAT
jgi:hypothetical protein